MVASDIQKVMINDFELDFCLTCMYLFAQVRGSRARAISGLCQCCRVLDKGISIVGELPCRRWFVLSFPVTIVDKIDCVMTIRPDYDGGALESPSFHLKFT